MEADFDLCGGIYPKGARHNGLLCGRKPDSGASSNAHKTPLCWIPPHTQPAQPTTPYRNVERALHVQATTAPAACERRALDGVAALCVAMKRDGVKRLRQRSGHTWIGAKAEGSFIAFCALSDCHCASEGAGLAGFVASAVTERSTVRYLSLKNE
jgi:hypothetical protein